MFWKKCSLLSMLSILAVIVVSLGVVDYNKAQFIPPTYDIACSLGTTPVGLLQATNPSTGHISATFCTDALGNIGIVTGNLNHPGLNFTGSGAPNSGINAPFQTNVGVVANGIQLLTVGDAGNSFANADMVLGSQTSNNKTGLLFNAGTTFANLGAAQNGTILYCNDCNSTCSAGASTGKMCARENGGWTAF